MIGGRVRGARPPRAPTTTERTDGASRTPPIELAAHVAAKAEEVVTGRDEPLTARSRREKEQTSRQTG